MDVCDALQAACELIDDERVPDPVPDSTDSWWPLLIDMQGDFSIAHAFVRRSLREAAEPGWRSRAGRSRR